MIGNGIIDNNMDVGNLKNDGNAGKDTGDAGKDAADGAKDVGDVAVDGADDVTDVADLDVDINNGGKINIGCQIGPFTKKEIHAKTI